MDRINLDKIGDRTYKVLSGADLGKTAREKFLIDILDKQKNTVTFVIPDSVYSLNSSFFSGLFQKSIRDLGEERFREQYLFECSDIIRANIDDGIFYIMNTLNLLGGSDEK